MRQAVVVGSMGLVCLVTVTRSASAESVERAAFSLEGALAVNEELTLKPGATYSGGESVDESSTAWGLNGGGFGFGLAYGVSSNFVVAAQLLLAKRNFEQDYHPGTGPGAPSLTASIDASTLSVRPRLEYVFGDSGAVTRPALPP